MMHGHEKSDPAIVAVKPANKAVQPAAEQSAAELTAAEPVEPRAGTKGNAGQQTMPWTQSQISMPHALERIRKAVASPSHTRGGSRMRESRTCGSVRGALSNGRPYRVYQYARLVMPALVAGIHVLKTEQDQRRGWPGQARP